MPSDIRLAGGTLGLSGCCWFTFSAGSYDFDSDLDLDLKTTFLLFASYMPTKKTNDDLPIL